MYAVPRSDQSDYTFLIQWKALKCQTLSVAVDVIVLVCRSLSRDSFMLAMHILFCSCPCKVRSQVSDALSQALYNLSLAFLADFTLSDSIALIRFIAFSRKLRSAFRLDWKTWSQRSHVFCLTGTAVLHCGHTFVGGILTNVLPMTNNRTCKEHLPCKWEQNGC